MTTSAARESLITQYVQIINNGIPQGSLPPFKKWVKVLATELNVDCCVLMDEIRAAAMIIYKAQTHPE